MVESGDVREIIIIGSGPAGYTAGLYAARAMLEPLMFAGYMSGGQLMLTSDIENFPGYPKGIGGSKPSASGWRSTTRTSIRSTSVRAPLP